MNTYEGTYKVIGRDQNQSLPEIFETFQEALDAQTKWDNLATIEQYIGDTVEVVWEPRNELFVSNIYF